jgi:hypothetical protein
MTPRARHFAMRKIDDACASVDRTRCNLLALEDFYAKSARGVRIVWVDRRQQFFLPRGARETSGGKVRDLARE